MASRNSHTGDPRPGPSTGNGSRGHPEHERRNQERRRRSYSREHPKSSHSEYSTYAPTEIKWSTSGWQTATNTEDGERVKEKTQLRLKELEMKVEREKERAKQREQEKRREEYAQLLEEIPIGEGMLEERPETVLNVVEEGIRTAKNGRRSDRHKKGRPSLPKGTKPTGQHPDEHRAGSYYVKLYKVVYDKDIPNPHVKNSKDFVRRYNGKCGDKYKVLDYPGTPSDPRPKYRKVELPKNLIVPKLTVDDQYTGIPPKREVTISNLNDNVKKDFLLKMARSQKLEPEDVQVFYHPTTNKHLKMALILFRTSKDAALFVDSNNNTKVMGQDFSCRLDPFAAELSSMYTAATSANLPKLQYLEGMSEHELSLRREKLIKLIAGPSPPPPVVETAPSVPPPRIKEERNRSLSPMDTSNSPPYEALLPPPPIGVYPPPHSHHHQPHHQQQAYDDPGASTSRMPSPPPPYSELPPRYPGMYEQRRSESRKHSTEPEGRARSGKRRRRSTSSSSPYSSGEGHSSRHRSDGGVKKKKKEEYFKMKRVVSSERDSKGEISASILTEEVTYKMRTEQRIEHKEKSPDSFDEEMKRRERSLSRERRNQRNAETRGRSEVHWGDSPSSESDSGTKGSRRKRAKEREDHSRDSRDSRDEQRHQPLKDPPPTPTPSMASSSSVSSTPRRKGFHSAPIFDPSLPPPKLVPPVGLVVLPDCASVPPPALIPLPAMMVPPPPLPGGFIPPPELFGLQSTPAMNAAVFAAAAGMSPMPRPSPMSMGGYTPMHSFASPVKAAKTPRMFEETAAATSSPLATKSSGIVRATSSSSLTTSARTPAEMKTPGTPSPSDGGCTPSVAAVTASAEKKVNLDDRLTQIFGIKKTKKEEDGGTPIKHVASAPSMSALAVDQMGQDDDMEIDDDDNMDVASSSSEGATKAAMIEMEKRVETRDTEEERRNREETERRAKEKEVDRITAVTTDKLIKDLEGVVARDIQKKVDNVIYEMMEAWCKKARSEEEEKKKQMIRETAMAQAAARDAKDPMEERLTAKLLSPEGLGNFGISKVFSSINIVKKKIIQPEFSRDGTPASRDSRAQSRARSRSASRSSDSSGDSSSDSDEEEKEERRRSATRRRPNMRNMESSQESSVASTSSESSDSESEDSSEKENLSKRGSPMNDEDVDVTAMSEDEADRIKKELGSGSSPDESGPSTSAASATAATVVDKVPFVSGRSMGAQGRLIPAPAAALASARAPAGGKMPTAVAPPAVPRPIKKKVEVKKRVGEADRLPSEVLNLLSTHVPPKEKRQKKIYKQRTKEEEDLIRDSFKAGVDAEDDKYLRLVLEDMQKDGARPFGDREVVYESKIRAYTPLELPVPAKFGKLDLFYDDEELAGVVPHSAGCARAQGFYRLSFKQKIRIMRNPEAFQDKTEINERDEVVKRHQVQASKEQRSMNRRLQTMVDSNPNSEFFKVNQLKYRKKMIKFARSRIHGWGLYALEPIAPDDMIVEYIGQKIRPIVADEREKQYERRGIGSSYLFRIDEDEVIDATRQGNFARFINHSCQPNCYAKVVTVDGDKRIVIYSKSLINKGDEITYDYKFPLEEDKIECLCGAPACRGTLN